MARLFFANIPYDCHETELQCWIESRGFDVDSIRLIRDQVAGVSPSFGYVSMRGVPDLQAAIKTLVRKVGSVSLDVIDAYTSELIAAIRASEEGRDGVAAFLEKRKPKWME